VLQKTRGIVLHSLKYGDTSLILKIFTEESGLRSFLVKGARSRKSGLRASLFQPLTPLALDVSLKKQGGNFDSIRDAECLLPLQGVNSSITKQAIALFITEVLYKTIEEDHPQPELFEFVIHMLTYLDETTSVPAGFPHYFLVHYSKYLGLFPGGESEATAYFDMREGIFSDEREWHADFMAPEESDALKRLLETPLGELHELNLNAVQRNNLLNALLHYYKIHLLNLREIKSHTILAEVLRS
jgi:DNA repair protein RecO (recombination protein O)